MALAQVFFCDLCEIFKNSFFTEHLWATASVVLRQNICELPSSQASTPKRLVEYLEDDCTQNLAYFQKYFMKEMEEIKPSTKLTKRKF